MANIENDIEDMLLELSDLRPSEISCLSVSGLKVLQSAYHSFLSYASCGEANARFYADRLDVQYEEDLNCLEEVHILLDNYAAQRPKRYFRACGSFYLLNLLSSVNFSTLSRAVAKPERR